MSSAAYTRTAKDLLKFMRSHPDLPQLRNNPNRLLSAMDEFSATRDFLVNIGSEKGKIITEVIAKENPKTLVEIGGYVGYSSILFADQMRKLRPDARVWSLEYNPQHAKIISEMVTLAGLQDIVSVVTGPGDEGLRRLKNEGQLSKIDLLFLDHVEDLYEQDLRVARDELQMLDSGAVVVADNVLWPGAPAYLRYVRKHKGLSSKGVKGRVQPGNIMDEVEISRVL